MDDRLLDAMKAEAARRYPNEACGLVVEQRGRAILIPCENASESPRDRFRITPQDYGRAADQGEVLAIWHSHCDEEVAKASEWDIESCMLSDLPWYILGVTGREDGFDFSEILAVEPEPLPYLGRPYVFGVHDCWTLARDWYRQELGIELRDFVRADNFWMQGDDLFGRGIELAGFAELKGQEPQPGDLFLFRTEGRLPNHVAIYLGDDLILHHCHGRLSRRETFSGFWQRHVTHHTRHISKC
jgi:proteasome lid subunit RPN8/RPN11